MRDVADPADLIVVVSDQVIGVGPHLGFAGAPAIGEDAGDSPVATTKMKALPQLQLRKLRGDFLSDCPFT